MPRYPYSPAPPGFGGEPPSQEDLLTPAEVLAMRNDFNREMTGLVFQLRVDHPEHTEEELARWAFLEYTYRRHRERRRLDLENENTGPLSRLLRNVSLGTVAATTRFIHEQIYRRAPLIERGVNVAKEVALGAGAVVAGRAVASKAVEGLAGQQVISLVSVSGAPSLMIGSALGGGIAGGLLGYRRGGERFVNKNFSAENLLEEYEVNDLIRKHELAMERGHDDPDTRYEPGRFSAGLELSEDYYRKVSEALAHMDAIAESGMQRGTFTEKAYLADRRAKLASILETQAFFQEQVRNGLSGEYFPPDAPMDLVRLENLWIDLQEYRRNHGNLEERFSEGLTQKAQQFIREQRREARRASWKGAGLGFVTGALVGATFGFIKGGGYGERILEGFGGGHTDPTTAIPHAMDNPEYGTLTNLLGNQQQLNAAHNMLNPERVEAINAILHKFNLSNFEHFNRADGGNYLLDIMQKMSDHPSEETQAAVYNFISHFDHNYGAFTPEGWHAYLASLIENNPSQLADAATFDLARETWLDTLRASGKMSYGWYLGGPEQINQALDGAAIAGAVAGYGVGQYVGEYQTPTNEYSNQPAVITAEAAESRGKKLPVAGDIWEIQPGAINYNISQMFPGLADNDASIVAVVDHVIEDHATGNRPYARLTIKELEVSGKIVPLPTELEGERSTFKVAVDEMVYNTSFQLREPSPVRLERKVGASLDMDSFEPSEVAKYTDIWCGKEFDFDLTIEDKGSRTPGSRFSLKAAKYKGKALDLEITDLNDRAKEKTIEDYIRLKSTKKDATIKIKGFAVGLKGKPLAKIV